jgi:ABC-type nickel/cobalt efflux system permease component RcnA
MRYIRLIALLLFCLGCLLAGSPVQAHEEDSVMEPHTVAAHNVRAGEHESYADSAHEHDTCDHHKAAHGKCCMTCGASAAFLSSQFFLPVVSVQAEKIWLMEQTLLSHFAQTQDRPPKLHS